jgi:general secretion pathway protein D
MKNNYYKVILLLIASAFLMIGNISCSGTKSQVKAEQGGELPPELIREPQPEQIPPPSKQEEAVPGTVAEVSKGEKLPELPTPTSPPPSPPPPPPTPPLTPPSPPVRITEPQKGSGVIFNFDNADLYEVVRVMAEIMRINYIIDPKVRGVVNIHTVGQIPVKDVFPIFQSILRMNGATAVKKENLYEIIPFSDAKKVYTPPSPLKEQGRLLPEERFVIQIVTVKYIPVTEVSKLIKPFLSDGADIIEHPPHNIIIIGDIASNVKKCLDIIALFDTDIFTDMRVRIYPIINADVTEIAKEMERIFSSFEVSLKSARGVGITFTPITRINSLLVVSSIPNIFEKVEGWLKELDKTPAEGTKLSVFVYYVQNGKAKDLADVLKQIFVAPKEKKVEYKEKVTPEAPPTPRGVKPPTPTPTPATKEEAGVVPEGEINIVVDETTNALIIKAFQRDYKVILETIKKLDLYPKQVLIEVFLAEVTLDDANRFGLEWSRLTDSFRLHGRDYTYTVGMGGIADSSAMVSGIRYSIVEAAGRLTAAIHAAAIDNRVKVISSPHILASNNKEAKIQIGSAQPILTNTYTTTATGTPGVVEGTIEYKDIGILLTVTPRINDGGLVTLEISIESSSVDSTALGNLQSIPVFKKKTAKTILSIMEGQTIVIGGLIEESKTVNKSGVPLLSKIPLLGSLFGYHDYDKTKTELVLLMTPHVIADLVQSNAVTQEFREKVETIKKELKKKEEEEEKKKK